VLTARRTVCQDNAVRLAVLRVQIDNLLDVAY
jgi:hypothetical protein